MHSVCMLCNVAYDHEICSEHAVMSHLACYAYRIEEYWEPKTEGMDRSVGVE